LTLVLCDKNNRLIIHVNKNILYSSCIYFEKLLDKFQEKNSNSITIEVSNAYVAYDVIMSFYGQETNSGNLPRNKHLLELIKCHDFFGKSFFPKGKDDLDNTPRPEGFGLEYVLTEEDIEIPEEDFELLLDVIDLVGYNDKTIKLINKNLPKNYDLTKFPKELLQEMLTLFESYNLISGSSDNTVKIWNTETGELLKTLDDHDDEVNCVCYSPDQKLIASASTDYSIKIWDACSGDLIKTLVGHDGFIICVCFSSDNKLLATASKDVKLWNAVTYELICTLVVDVNYIMSLCFSPDNKYIAYIGNIFLSHGIDGIGVKIWNTITHQLVNILNDDKFSCIDFAPDSQRMVTGSNGGKIKIWNPITGELIGVSCDKHIHKIICIRYSSDNRLIVSGGDDKTIKIWDAATSNLISTLIGHSSAIYSICFSPNNKFIASGSYGTDIKIWNTETLELVKTLKYHTDRVNSVCFSKCRENELVDRIKQLINQ